MQILVASLLLLVASAHAKLLTLHSPRFQVLNKKGEQTRSEPISLTQKSKSPVALNTTDTLKITFQVIDKDSGDGFQPHQTFLRFYDATTGEEGIQPIRVTPGGKAKFQLDVARPPNSLPPTGDAPLAVSLFIGKPEYSPVVAELFDLHVPHSQPAPVHPDEASFHPLPEIHHAFRPDQKLPPKFVSAVFSALVIAPWAILLGLWSQVSPRLTHAFSPSILSFIASLGAYEVLIFYYWVNLTLGQVLLYGGILAVVTLFTGKYALRSIATRRVNKN
ncbi:oligosaccharyl transferase delta subunit [Macrolepiota fuliginosa MF-IS2]|uniref:Ribophorin II n=1 Tax=Macrolepiota fuliginosa MF-IS2 TaxID=1400762 RepID=A0A9P5X733_9AGAR|nr:oligosaccharyl transferase delta subunit [Macrolepiota fuliginosa MF-IS2]